MSIIDNSRLTIEVPRCSKRYKQIKNIRSSSEGTNSYTKQLTGLRYMKINRRLYCIRTITGEY